MTDENHEIEADLEGHTDTVASVTLSKVRLTLADPKFPNRARIGARG